MELEASHLPEALCCGAARCGERADEQLGEAIEQGSGKSSEDPSEVKARVQWRVLGRTHLLNGAMPADSASPSALLRWFSHHPI